MPCRAFNTVEQMRAAGTGAVTLRSEHIAVNQDRREFAEQLGEPDLLGPEVGADALEDIILGHLAAGRKRAAHLGHDLGLATERDFGVEQRVARLAIRGAFIGESHASKAEPRRCFWFPLGGPRHFWTVVHPKFLIRESL